MVDAMGKYRTNAAVALSIAVLFSRPVSNQIATSDHFSVEEATAAVEWGRTHEVRPYPIRNAIHGGSSVGAAFTRFVRIALAARAEMRKGGSLEPKDLPPWLGEPLVYLAMWGKDDFPASTVPIDAPFHIELLPQTNAALLGSAKAEQPTWLSLGDSSLGRFGATLDHEIAAVGAFSVDALNRSGAVVLYRSAHDAKGHRTAATWGILEKADLDNWR